MQPATKIQAIYETELSFVCVSTSSQVNGKSGPDIRKTRL